MRQFINGASQAPASHIAGTDSSFNVVCVDDCAGTALDLTGVTATVEIYDEVNKGGTLTSLSGVLGTLVGGHFTFAIADDQAVISTYLPGTDLYMYAKIDDAGAISIADNPVILRIV
jgi:hypothetical protein